MNESETSDVFWILWALILAVAGLYQAVTQPSLVNTINGILVAFIGVVSMWVLWVTPIEK